MTKLRLLHQRTVTGDILVNDIDQGLPVEHLDEERKQDVYVTYNLKKIQSAAGGGLEVSEDPDTPGFIDLVLSDKVKLSQADGVIKGLSDAGLVSAIEIPTGALAAPTLTNVIFDSTEVGDDFVGTVDDGSLDITGTNLASFSPDTTSIAITDGVTTEVVDGNTAGVTVSSTSITIEGSAHTFGASPGAVTSVTVTANGQDATRAVDSEV